ncbi:helix-turn-helix domain-containing protein [Lachnospiraceae bacterium OttesenSCG-928-D06]|nr:helix-turn-helix domain-containing protein [Lachnospiraceae bacterium OttesenSCG-928-D06]
MQIGTIIRKYRLEKNLTQEEVAKYLGVTAPAVNKWEKGHSMPDITLLSPIARLFDITLDTLLSHKDSLTDEEANRLIMTAYERLKAEPFEVVFSWAKEQFQTYPNSAFLSLGMTQILSSHIKMEQPEEEDMYTPYFISCYQRALESDSDRIKAGAADALYYHYMGKKEFDKAEGYLNYFSKENPERKRKLASIYQQTDRKKEALQMYEELLYSGYQNINLTFHDIYILALEDKDFKKAHEIVEKLKSLAQLFEMGEYHEISSGLELAILEKDSDRLFTIMNQLLKNIESISGFTNSSLYSHMNLKPPREEYYNEVRQSLLDCLKEEQFDFIQGDQRFDSLYKIDNMKR